MNIFGYDDFVGSKVGQEPASNEDKCYDPNSITEVEVEEEDYDEKW